MSATVSCTASPSSTLDPETSLPRASDPLNLSSALKSDAEIREIAATHRVPRSYTLGRRGSSDGKEPKKKVDVKGIKGFYQAQNARITGMLKSVDDHRREAKDEKADSNLRFKIAVHGSFIANISLSILQMYAAISSGSLSLFATMADAVFDPISNLVLILSHRAVNRVDPDRFPSGKARLETAGNIGFACLMISVSFILVALSGRDLASGNSDETKAFHLPSVVAVACALTVKIALFFYCWGIKDTYSQAQILWLDHRNDLPVNVFGLITSVCGSKLRWWIDPLGAIIIGLIIFLVWMKVVYEESLLLIGVRAEPEYIELLTYVSMTHDDRITHIDTVRAYHSGPRIIAEVDIVMAPESTLRETHDVAEALQIKLESLPDVERAYVHVDWESEHKPEHFMKKEL